MKRKITRKMSDGSMHIVEEDDEAPAHRKAEMSGKNQGPDAKSQYLERMASQGHKGDTRLAHVSPWEEALLKKLGGVGTRNPHTGLKQFYTKDDISSWYTNALGRPADPGGLDYWTNYAATNPDEQVWKAFSAGTTAQGAVEPGLNAAWNPGQIGGLPAVNLPGANTVTGPVVDTPVPGMGTSTNAPPTYYTPTKTLPTTAEVTGWYQQNLGRAPSAEDLAYWTTYGDQPTESADPFEAFKAGAMGNKASETGINPAWVQSTTPVDPALVGVPQEKVTEVTGWYQNAFGRTPNAAEIAYWAKYSGSGTPFEAFVRAGVEGGENYLGWKPAGYTPNPNNLYNDKGVWIGQKQKTTVTDIPLNIMPTSRTNSNSYSGLPTAQRDALLAALMPQLTNSITNMGANYDKYTNEALGSYQQMMQNALRKNIPAALGGLANRGILSSTEGNKVLSDVFSNAATDASTKGYQTAMQAALLKANMPNVLKDMVSLGSSNTSSSSSYSEDPTVLYRELAATIRAMMGS